MNLPIVAIGVTILVVAVIWLVGGLLSSLLEPNKTVLLVILVILTVIAVIGVTWYYTGTAVGRRAWKSQQSNFTNGLNREVKVYSMDGKLIKEYSGKFDIEYDDDRILFDDEKGNRHIIYYPTGTVIVDEVN